MTSIDIDHPQLQRLSDWLSRELPDMGPLVEIERISGGQSNPTYTLSCKGGKCILRRRPSGVLLPRAHMIEREYAVMSALADSGLPIPKMYAICDDTELIGVQFYVMERVEGRIFWDPSLPELTADHRSKLYASMNQVVAQLHQVDPAAVGLGGFGKPEGFMERQVKRWTQQYRASETIPIDAMELLIEWLPRHLPKDSPKVSIFHGDLRLDNIVFHPAEARVVAILDWELSTLGDPVADLAYHTMTWRIPPSLFRGLGGLDLAALGIPEEHTYLKQYYDRTGFERPESWRYYLAFSFFRLAAILQGVAARAQQGNASSSNATELGARAHPLAEIGWKIAQGED